MVHYYWRFPDFSRYVNQGSKGIRQWWYTKIALLYISIIDWNIQLNETTDQNSIKVNKGC